MQVDETLRARSTNVVELFSHSRCLRCQERNRRCHIDRGNTGCLQCDNDNLCVFTRTVSRTASASAFTWTELTGLSPSTSSVGERSAPLPGPASALQNHQHGQGSSSAMADPMQPTQRLLPSPPTWINSPLSHLGPVNSSANGGVDVLSYVGTFVARSSSQSPRPHGKRVGPLSHEGRENARRMRKFRSCVRCLLMKEQVCSPRLLQCIGVTLKTISVPPRRPANGATNSCQNIEPGRCRVYEVHLQSTFPSSFLVCPLYPT
jgi:hypothetical protein